MDGGEATTDDESKHFLSNIWANPTNGLLPIIQPPDFESLYTGVEPTNWFAYLNNIGPLDPISEPNMDTPDKDSDEPPELEACSDSLDGDEMPDLVAYLEPSDDKEDTNWLDDEEIFGNRTLARDKGEEACTNYSCAMLAGIFIGSPDIEVELYDSGATLHMSPYMQRFENYVQTAPKSITAANKQSFQAIGKGDLQIQIPDGKNTTVILLKDVLYCPDIGVTLIPIS